MKADTDALEKASQSLSDNSVAFKGVTESAPDGVDVWLAAPTILDLLADLVEESAIASFNAAGLATDLIFAAKTYNETDSNSAEEFLQELLDKES